LHKYDIHQIPFASLNSLPDVSFAGLQISSSKNHIGKPFYNHDWKKDQIAIR